MGNRALAGGEWMVRVKAGRGRERRCQEMGGGRVATGCGGSSRRAGGHRGTEAGAWTPGGRQAGRQGGQLLWRASTPSEAEEGRTTRPAGNCGMRDWRESHF